MHFRFLFPCLSVYVIVIECYNMGPIDLLVFHNWKCTAFTHVMNKWHVVRPNSNHSVFIYNGNLIYYYSIFYTEIDNCNW